MTPDEARYYASHSVESDPKELGELLDALPEDPKPLLDAVAGLILDTAFVAPLGVVCPPDSADDIEIRPLREMLARIVGRGSGSLAAARPPEKRFIGACRHYALLACSALRHHGVPSRVRVGFANYFEPGFHDDHWIVDGSAGVRSLGRRTTRCSGPGARVARPPAADRGRWTDMRRRWRNL